MKKFIKEYAIVNLGLILIAIGIYFFLMPNNLAPGGVSGLAIIFNRIFPWMTVGAIMISLNIFLFILGFIFIGFDFGAKTIYSSFALSGMVWLLEKLYVVPKPILNDLMLELIIAMVLSGIGMALVFQQNASTGGTDITAKILNKYFHTDIGKAVLFCDLFVVVLSGFIFEPRICIYGLFGVVLNGILIDYLMQSMNSSKEVVIVSEESDKIKGYIMNNLGRGTTIYDAKGGFTDEPKEVIRTILRKKEFIQLKKYINKFDIEAFITVNNVHETFGEGFVSIK